MKKELIQCGHMILRQGVKYDFLDDLDEMDESDDYDADYWLCLFS